MVRDGIDKIVGTPAAFDPNLSEPFRIASADCMEAIYLPPLIQRLCQQVPEAGVIVRGIDASFDYAEAPERDDLDVVICNWPGAPGHLKTAHLTIEQYLAADHVAPVARSRADPGPIDLQLVERGLRRSIR